MVIAVHISRSLHLYQKAFNACFAFTLAEMYPEFKFVFVHESGSGIPEKQARNSTIVRLRPAISSRLALWYQYRFGLPALLKKHKVELFITAGDICCLNSRIRQFVILHESEVWQPRLRKFLERSRKRTIAKASKLFAAGNAGIQLTGKMKLGQLHPGPEQLICIPELSNRAMDAAPDLPEMTYFLFISSSGREDEYILMLKAFSLFKKWQKSSLKLVIMSTNGSIDGLSALSSYKFREDVSFIKPVRGNYEGGLLTGAYAVVSLRENTAALTGLRSMSAGVPFLTLEDEGNRRFFKDNCLYSRGTEPELGQNLILVYKDEVLRSELIRKGIEYAKGFSAAACAMEIAAAISGHN